MRLSTAAALAAATAFLSANPTTAGELPQTGTFYWTFAGSMMQQGTEGRFAAIGKVVGYTTMPDAEPAIRFMPSECLGWAIAGEVHAGSCINRVASGDMYWLDYSCPEPTTPPPGGMFACKGSSVVKGGTGVFAGIKGGNTYIEVTTGILPDGTMVGYTEITGSDISF